MNYIQGTDRKQAVLYAHNLDEIIDKYNEVRAIDIFVNSLNLKDLGFIQEAQITGRPPYNPADLLKLYIYSYMNRHRSSREIEKETKRNVEVMWLINNLQPDHNTIANFRKNNSEPIRKVFEATVTIAKNRDLIGGKLIAGDSVKLRAQNSKKNNFNKEKLENQIAYLDKKIAEYNQLLDKEDNVNQEITVQKKEGNTSQNHQQATTNPAQSQLKEIKEEYLDTPQTTDKKEIIKNKLEKHVTQRTKYKNLLEKLSQSQETQISTSDPDSRNLPIRQQITEVAYSVQTTADAKNKILLDYEVTNKTDKAALYTSVNRAANILQTNEFVALYDKGYFSGAEIAKCQQMGVTPLVSIPPRANASEVPTPKYHGDKFVYNRENDTYLCPDKQVLSSNGTIYKSDHGSFKQYKTAACKNCPSQKNCTTAKSGIRIIERTEYADNVEYNKKLIDENKDLYRLRQEIIEHPFGTMKRQWGFDHTLMKRDKDRVSSDIGLIFIAYNLRRLINILIKSGLNGTDGVNILFKLKNVVWNIFKWLRLVSKISNFFFPIFNFAVNSKRVNFGF